MDKFVQFCNLLDFSKTTKVQQAIAFIWFHGKISESIEVDLKTIMDYFSTAYLPRPNITRLKSSLAKSRDVYRGEKANYFRLTRTALEHYEKEFGHLFLSSLPSTIEKASVERTPLLTQDDIENAKKMAELYIILHCYENSARKLIESVLSTHFGDEWWAKTSNSAMKQKIISRKEKEKKSSWISPRSNGSELYYSDWDDLLSLIRKYESLFLPYLKEIKFAILRFEELERVRNIIAHNGVLPSKDDFDRVILSFRDWCKQLRSINIIKT